jgi:hypothetical protein
VFRRLREKLRKMSNMVRVLGGRGGVPGLALLKVWQIRTYRDR